MNFKTVVFPFVGDSLGGSHLATLELIAACRELQHEFKFKIWVAQKGPLSKFLDNNSITYELISGLPISGREVSPFQQIKKLVSSTLWLLRQLKNCDLHIIHTNDARMHITWALVCRLKRIPHVMHQRGRFPGDSLHTFPLTLSSAVICVSNYVRETISPRFSKKVHQVYDFKSFPYLPERPPKRFETDRPMRIIFLGTLSTQKRPDLFLDFACRILELDPDLEFFIFGREDAFSFDQLMKPVHRDKKKKFVWKGFVQDIGSNLRQFDILIAPGVNDALPNSVIEACASGLLVFAADSGGNPEIITHEKDGFLISDFKNKGFLKYFLGVVRNNELREKISNAAWLSSREKFFNTEIPEKIINIYRNLTNAHHKHPNAKK